MSFGNYPRHKQNIYDPTGPPVFRMQQLFLLEIFPRFPNVLINGVPIIFINNINSELN